MSALLAGLAAAAVVLVARRPPGEPERRLRRLQPGRPRSAASAPPGSRRPSRQWAVAALAGVAAALLVGGAAGLVTGLVVAAAVPAVARRLPAAGQAARRRRLEAALPLVLDLLASCLRAGLTWPDALVAAARAAGPDLAPALTAVAAALRGGLPAADAWAVWTAEPVLAEAGRSLARAQRTGAAAAPAATRLAARAREVARARAEQRARAVAVWAVGPLMLCFLPAFVLVGVVPVVVALLGSLPL